MGDLIKREDAINAIEMCMHQGLGKTEEPVIVSDLDSVINLIFTIALAKVKCLPSADQRWIPCKDRLPKIPEERDWYLGIFRESDTGWVNRIPFVCDYVGEDTGITTKDFWILKDCEGPYYRNLECIAWRPLPAPYQENENSDKTD